MQAIREQLPEERITAGACVPASTLAITDVSRSEQCIGDSKLMAMCGII